MSTRSQGWRTSSRLEDLRIVGQSPQRYDIPPKVDGSLTWAVDVTCRGWFMLATSGRRLRAPHFAASTSRPSADLPGFIRVVSRGNYVAVVCEREEQAIDAARRLQVDWDKPAAAPFPTSDELYAYMRSATPTSSAIRTWWEIPRRRLRGAAQVIEAEYDFPFQGHTAIGPAHASGRPVRRSDDDLLQRHEVLRHAER